MSPGEDGADNGAFAQLVEITPIIFGTLYLLLTLALLGLARLFWLRAPKSLLKSEPVARLTLPALHGVSIYISRGIYLSRWIDRYE